MPTKSFSQFTADDDDLDEGSFRLSEGSFRNVSAAVLVSKIHDRSRKIHSTKDIEKKLNLIASQNTHLAALIWSMTQFVTKK